MLSVKKAIVNVQNSDNYCFLYLVLAQLYPVSFHSEHVTNYEHHLCNLNYQELHFPLKHTDVPKFEKLNPDIYVNVLCYEDKDLYCTQLNVVTTDIMLTCFRWKLTGSDTTL